MTDPTPTPTDVAAELIPRKVRGWIYLGGSVVGGALTTIGAFTQNTVVLLCSSVLATAATTLAAVKTSRA